MTWRLGLVLLAAAPATCILPEHAALLTRAHKELQSALGPSAATAEELKEAVEEESKNVDLLTAYGYVLRSRNEPEDALVPLKQALKLGKKQGAEGQPVVLHDVVVTTLVDLERFKEAAAVYKKYGYPLAARMHQGLALRLAQTASDDEAADAARVHAAKAVELAPDEPTSNLCHGFSLLMRRGADEEAVPTETAISVLQHAFQLREEGKSDALFPDGWPAGLEAHARHMLGNFMAQNPPKPAENGRLELARQQFAKANALVPDYKPYSNSLNEIYTAMIQRQQALGTSNNAMQAEMDAALARESAKGNPLGSVPIIDMNKQDL